VYGWGWFRSWGTVYTNANGEFQISKSKNRDPRRFKIELKFQNDDLEIRHEHSTSSLQKCKWYLAYEKVEDQSPGTSNLGTFMFRPDGYNDMGENEPRSHADIWTLARLAMSELRSYGSSYGFSSKLKYPHDVSHVTASYANPYTNVVYILPTGFDAKTILHEMMHSWSYRQGSGEEILLETLLANDYDTHGFTNTPTAFLEGFAEYAAEELMQVLFGTHKILPFNRSYLNDGVDWSGHTGDVLSNLAKMGRHDAGWLSMLRIMTADDLLYLDLLEKGESWFWAYVHEVPYLLTKSNAIVDPPDLTFKDVLRVFQSKPSAGYDDPIKYRHITVPNFLERAKGILSNLNSTQAAGLKELWDPASTEQPSDVFIH